jgi:hypothetical protein
MALGFDMFRPDVSTYANKNVLKGSKQYIFGALPFFGFFEPISY